MNDLCVRSALLEMLRVADQSAIIKTNYGQQNITVCVALFLLQLHTSMPKTSCHWQGSPKPGVLGTRYPSMSTNVRGSPRHC
jgi:hypothetical protein